MIDTKHMDIEGCKRLANAIIITAINDYKHGVISEKQFRNFIYSEYFLVLSRGCVHPDAIMEEVGIICRKERVFLN